MSALHKGLIVAAAQILMMASVGAKFLVDRAIYPRVWIATGPVDPDLPFRGRYLQLSAVVAVENSQNRLPQTSLYDRAHLAVRHGLLVAVIDPAGDHLVRATNCGAARCWVLTRPLAYFIPEHGTDPSHTKPGEQLWVEASIPPTGPPRPIRLGNKSR